jgi:hypothetical protein
MGVGIFKIRDNKVVIDPLLLLIPEWKEVWDRDTTKDKSVANQELLYIYFMSEQKRGLNPYIDYSEDTRSESIIKGHINIAKWVPDAIVKKAIEKNVELQVKGNASLRFLNSLKRVMQELTIKFEGMDIDERYYKGKPIYKFSEIIAASAKAKDMVTTIEALEEKVLKEDLNKKTKSKRDLTSSAFED